MIFLSPRCIWLQHNSCQLPTLFFFANLTFHVEKVVSGSKNIGKINKRINYDIIHRVFSSTIEKKDFEEKEIAQFNKKLRLRIGLLFDKLYIPVAYIVEVTVMSSSGFDVELLVPCR